MVKLVRKAEEVVVPEPLAEALNELAMRAETELGYGALAQKLKAWKSERTAAEVKRQFLGILENSGIIPISKASVDAYKSFKVGQEKQKKEWNINTLSQYDRIVPDFAIERALGIHTALNKAGLKHNFFIEELVERQSERYEYRDPFLFIRLEVCGGERFYLDVWEEPEFEGRRTV